ncbi:phage antirepressor N-terminal domain-containing protein [Haemophilus parainfluenzae]|uniref:Putative antirepressor protein n=1 Tax=Haemophilus parainfluenzae TaxID=729 RepID=A0A377JES7_HAEPA|nr:phage antirepressor N-terminal domain-containing protein [Haemophilus parainfluenzae]STP02628.1 putative antirepressor protein [Haemophilus parainfluenzae]STP06319.1 putative antirepressor protein [Haemophilus parainfluenzae]
MSNQISTQTISFNNQSLITVEQNGVHYVAMKPICENIGIQWESQYNRIRRDDVLNSVIFIMNMTGSDSKNYQMICLPIEYLNGWLFGIDINRCNPEIRDTLIKYKKECYQALHDYWFNGKAERKTTVDDRTGLRNAVNMLVSKKGLIYSEAYHLVHQRFNVESIEDLTLEQLPQAVEYVHKIILEGELITEAELPSREKKFSFEFTEYELQQLIWLWFAFKRGVGTFQHIERAFNVLGSNMSGQIYGQAYEYLSVLRSTNKILNRITQEFEIDPMTNWRVLKHLRGFNPKAVKIDF